MQAVIPSVTVENINGIKGLSDCLVHVADINTTYYIDDHHRLLTTWGGPVSVYNYDFDENPLRLRNQMAYDTANNILAIFDKAGVAYTVPISDLDNDYAVLINKPQINGHELSGNQTSAELGLQNELIAGENIQIEDDVISATDTTYTAGNGIELDGTEIKAKIGDGLEFDNNGEIDIADIEQYAHFFDNVAEMKSAENLVNGSYAETLGYYIKNDGGGAKYLIIESTGVATNGCNLIELDNGLVAQLLVTSPANVKQFGAVGDANTDDTDAIQCALHSDTTIYFPQGRYLTTETLSFENRTLIGAGEQLTGILGISEDASKPVIAMGGQAHLRNLYIGFKTSSLTGTLDDTNRIGIVLHGGYRDLALNSGSIRDVIIRNTYTAISDTGTKSPFSNTFENIFIEKFKQRGIFLSSTTRTGNVYNNIYLTNIGYVSKGNADTVTVRSGIRMVGEESECTMTQINIEHMTAYYPVYIENVKGLTITSMHLEGVRNESANMPFVQLEKTQGVIDNISFYYTRHRTGQSLIRLGAVKETDTDIGKYGGKTALIINNLVCVGLNRPDYGIYGQGTAYPVANQTLGSSVITGFNFITRETASDKYCLILNSYTWRTWAYIQDDSSYYEAFASNPHNSIEWIKKGAQPITGTLADIPTSMKYAGMQYFDTASKKLLTYYYPHWYDGDGNQVV